MYRTKTAVLFAASPALLISACSEAPAVAVITEDLRMLTRARKDTTPATLAGKRSDVPT
jgi:hypothetical protein